MSMINPHQALEKLKNGQAMLIDVRNPNEFEHEHIAYAASIPLSQITTVFKDWHLADERVIIFQCQKGKRGEMACDYVSSVEGPHIQTLNIDGGIDAWKAAGLPVVSAADKKGGISLMRQVQIVVGLLIALCVGLGYAGVTIAFLFAGLFGTALFLAGLTGWCGMAMLLAKMPWNK